MRQSTVLRKGVLPKGAAWQNCRMIPSPVALSRSRRDRCSAPLACAALVALLALCSVAQAQAPAGSGAGGALRQQLDAYIAQPQFARADWGIAVRSLATGEALYAHNAGRLFVPASTAKLFTAALALSTLGSSTRIATTLYATSTRVGNLGVLRGDLILYGRGDPSLGLAEASPDWADRLAQALAARGVKRIEGNLIADATYFTGIPVGAGWEANDLQTWYGAVPSALDVEGNLIRVKVERSARQCCTVTVTPQAAGVTVVNQTSASATEPLGLYRPVGSSTLYAVGQLPARTREHTYVLSMPDSALTAGNLLREALARRGITLGGRVIPLAWPAQDPALTRPGTQAIASVDSPTLAELIDHTLKNSDNLFAQTLLLQAGVAAKQRDNCRDARRPDTSSGWALCALRAMLTQAGISRSAVLLDEGSGLARRDLVTPDAFVDLLRWASTQPWGPDLRSALPVAGIDGTLANRLRKGDARANVQAKTGTLSHAYALTGFVTNAAGEPLVFALMLNRYPRWEIESELPDVPSPKVALDALARIIAGGGT